ncbi:MAG: FadR family transcriptional regulator [Myxococcales bacterium]|nr:FadR family transcriptional regulator [Myxococcales bacterium]
MEPTTEGRVDEIADALRSSLLSGEHPVGQRLPPERQLAERFGVNRVTIRSALGRLASEGLVRARQGSGYVVRDFRRHGTLDLIPTLVASSTEDLEQTARDLLAIRRQLAALVAERLAAPALRADHDPFRPVRDAIDAFERAAEDGATTAELAQADLDVIASLLELTGSAVLQLCFNPVASVLAALPALCEAIYARPETNVVAYRALLARLDAAARGGAPPPPSELVALLAARDAATLERLRHSNPTVPS